MYSSPEKSRPEVAETTGPTLSTEVAEVTDTELIVMLVHSPIKEGDMPYYIADSRSPLPSPTVATALETPGPSQPLALLGLPRSSDSNPLQPYPSSKWTAVYVTENLLVMTSMSNSTEPETQLIAPPSPPPPPSPPAPAVPAPSPELPTPPPSPPAVDAGRTGTSSTAISSSTSRKRPRNVEDDEGSTPGPRLPPALRESSIWPACTREPSAPSPDAAPVQASTSNSGSRRARARDLQRKHDEVAASTHCTETRAVRSARIRASGGKVKTRRRGMVVPVAPP